MPLLDALRKRQFVLLQTYSVTGFLAAEDAKEAAKHTEELHQKAESKAALNDFTTRNASVVSAIHLNAPTNVVCIAKSPNPDGVRYFLRRTNLPFGEIVTANSITRDYASADEIFVALKRKQCTAAIAPAELLKQVIASLVRNSQAAEVGKRVITANQLSR